MNFSSKTEGIVSVTRSGNTFRNLGLEELKEAEDCAKCFFVDIDVSIDPVVNVSSNINDSKPVKIVDTDHAGFQVPGWKSDIDRQSLVLVANRPFGVIIFIATLLKFKCILGGL